MSEHTRVSGKRPKAEPEGFIDTSESSSYSAPAFILKTYKIVQVILLILLILLEQ